MGRVQCVEERVAQEEAGGIRGGAESEAGRVGPRTAPEKGRCNRSAAIRRGDHSAGADDQLLQKHGAAEGASAGRREEGDHTQQPRWIGDLVEEGSARGGVFLCSYSCQEEG